MSLIAEDGSCVVEANAFVTREELIEYATDFYPASVVGYDDVTDGAILRASRWLSTFPEWDGVQTCGRGLQGLAWPRVGVVDCNGDSIPDNEIPVEVKHATFLAALAELSTPGILSPTVSPGERVKRVKVDVIEKEFAELKDTSVDALRPVLTAISDLLRCVATFPDGKSVPWPWVA